MSNKKIKLEFGNSEHIKLRDKVEPRYYCEDCGEKNRLWLGICLDCGGNVVEEVLI